MHQLWFVNWQNGLIHSPRLHQALAPLHLARRLVFMGSGTFVDEFKESLEFTPVAGEPNVYLMQPRRGSHDRPSQEMSSEDWDQCGAGSRRGTSRWMVVQFPSF